MSVDTSDLVVGGVAERNDFGTVHSGQEECHC